MFKTVFILLLFAHVLGDFYLHSQKLAEREKSIYKVLLHSLLYTSACFVVIFPVINKWLTLAAILISVSHLIVDVSKWILINRINKINENGIVYIIDQAVHLIFIFISSVIVAARCDSLNVFPCVNYIFELINVDKLQALSLLLLMLLVWKPANITIKKLLSAYRPAEDPENKNVTNAGSFIGILERITILLFLSINQYSAIGLVLTAKSIARYNRISEDREFAEYYLLGTLLSTLIAIVAYFVVV